MSCFVDCWVSYREKTKYIPRFIYYYFSFMDKSLDDKSELLINIKCVNRFLMIIKLNDLN